jgi:hypothetical protein
VCTLLIEQHRYRYLEGEVAMPLSTEEVKSLKRVQYPGKRDPNHCVFLSFYYPETPREGFWSGMANTLDTWDRYSGSWRYPAPAQRDSCALRRDYLVVALGFLTAAKKLDRQLGGGTESKQKTDQQEQLFDLKDLG